MKIYKTVLVGCGGISNSWMSVATKHPAIQLVGLVDLNPESAHAQAVKYNLSPQIVYQNLAECLKKTKAGLVFDCTVPPSHRDVVLTAIEAGCHVFGEKPLAETVPDARCMVDAAKNAGVTYGVMQNRRWQPEGISRVRKVLDSGAIGNPHTLHSDFFIGAHFGGFRDGMKHVLLLDMAIHSFDQIRFLVDADPVKVWAADWNPPGSWYQHGASAMAMFEHAGNVRSSYRGSWCAEGFNSSWQCSWRIIGERGTLLWDGGDGIRAERVTGSEGFIRECSPIEIPEKDPEALSGHAAAIHDFIDALQQGRPPATPADENILSLAMVHAAIQSAERGESVSIPDLIKGH